MSSTSQVIGEIRQQTAHKGLISTWLSPVFFPAISIATSPKCLGQTEKHFYGVVKSKLTVLSKYLERQLIPVQVHT